MKKKSTEITATHLELIRLERIVEQSPSPQIHTLFHSNWVNHLSSKAFELFLILPVLALIVTPTYLLLSLVSFCTRRPIFRSINVHGQNGITVKTHHFNVPWPTLAAIGLVIDVLIGKLSLVGRVLASSKELAPLPQNGYLSETKPGLFSLWKIRENSKIGHEGRQGSDWEYRFTKSLKSDIGLLLRNVSTISFSSTVANHLDEINLFNITFSNTTMKNAIKALSTELDEAKATRDVFFVNADCLNKTFSDPAYKRTLQQADYVFPDGIGLVIAGKMLNKPLKENVNGTDMLPYICEMAKRKDKSIFLLGGKPGVAETMQQQLENKMGVTVAGCHHGYFNHQLESNLIVKEINSSGADILLVAFGAPLQEKWIAAHLDQLNPKIAMGVGGLFDFYSKKIKRAPRWLRELGLEWVYRILQEPRRMWQRYVIGNPLFLSRVIKWKISGMNK